MTTAVRWSALCALTVLLACNEPQSAAATADTAAAPAAQSSAQPPHAAEPDRAAEAEPSATAEAKDAADEQAAESDAPKAEPKAAARVAPPATKSAKPASAKPAVEVEKEGKFAGKKALAKSYAAWLQSAGRYSVGKASSVQAVLTAKGEFKCNEAYPHKFKLNAAPAGVSYPSKIARGANRGKKRTVVSVPFTPSSAGDKTISGTFYFSVCDDASCQIKKQPMSVTVTVHEN